MEMVDLKLMCVDVIGDRDVEEYVIRAVDSGCNALCLGNLVRCVISALHVFRNFESLTLSPWATILAQAAFPIVC